MAQIIIDTGVQEFDLNGVVTVRYNPADPAFIERLYNTFKDLDQIQEDIKSAMEGKEDNVEVFSIARNFDVSMRAKLNDLFDTDICTPLVGGVNIYALASGMPIWANIIFSILDTVDSTVNDQCKKTNPTINKYLKKYHK